MGPRCLLCGPVSAADLAGMASAAGATGGDAPHEDLRRLRADHDRLAEEVERLRALVERMASELGLSE